jgi:hypothetical protein
MVVVEVDNLKTKLVDLAVAVDQVVKMVVMVQLIYMVDKVEIMVEDMVVLNQVELKMVVEKVQ